MALVFDMETEPLARDLIEASLPEALRNPEMPDDIANPPKPDLAAKCPKYGGDEQKRAEWLAGKEAAWLMDSDAAKAAWKNGVADKRERFFRDAALDARTGRAKLMVLRDTLERETLVFLVEVEGPKIEALTAAEFRYTSSEKEAEGNSRVDLRLFATEAGMLKAFFAEFANRMASEKALEDSASCVGYYIKDFDFPFAYRRAWMNGVPQVPLFRRGRYYSDEIVDLHEMFSFGERQYKVGGLDGLAEALGCGGAKLGDGAGFADWYRRNPVEGVQYCLNDVQLTEEAGRKMGAIN